MWSQLIEIYQNNFGWNFVLMPLISGIIGWGTNVLALKMTFYPLEYKGVKIKGKKFLGWQGIVPEKAASMASRSVDMITTKLINVEDQFERLDPKRISEQMQPAILELTRDIFDDSLNKEFKVWKLLGLFIKRQKEVSSGYSKIIAENIMTMPRIFDAIYYGPSSDKLMQILEKHFNEGIDRSSGYTGTILKLTKGTETYERIKSEAVRRLIQAVPDQIDQIFEYSKEALDIEYTLNDKMSKLPPQDFVGFLRPVFQEDEWKLILVGAILGLVAGFLQIFVS